MSQQDASQSILNLENILWFVDKSTLESYLCEQCDKIEWSVVYWEPHESNMIDVLCKPSALCLAESACSEFVGMCSRAGIEVNVALYVKDNRFRSVVTSKSEVNPND